MQKKRSGKYEHKHQALIFTGIKCNRKTRKALQEIARGPVRGSCRDVVAECIGGPESHVDARVIVRAKCTSDKTQAEFQRSISDFSRQLKPILGKHK